MLKERDEFIIGEMHRCHKRREEDDHVQLSGQSLGAGLSGQGSGQSLGAGQFPPSGRAVQEKNIEPSFGGTEVAPVKYHMTKHETLSKARSITPTTKSSPVMDNLDNFSGKVDGEEEEDKLKGKAVEEEELDGFKGEGEDDLLTGEAVTALDGNPLLDANQAPAAIKEEGTMKGNGKTEPDALDWRQKENSDLPSVDIGKIKSILDETAN